jgi:hypothetical protein
MESCSLETLQILYEIEQRLGLIGVGVGLIFIMMLIHFIRDLFR